jgi:hypothetical protein
VVQFNVKHKPQNQKRKHKTQNENTKHKHKTQIWVLVFDSLIEMCIKQSVKR